MPKFNFGHLVWEEISAIYLTIKRFNIDIDANPIVMDMKDYTKTEGKHLYEKFTSFFIPVITQESVRHTLPYIKSFGKEYVCFKKLLVPSFSRFFLDYRDSFNEGKEPLLFQFRNDIINYYKLDPFTKPKMHRILLNSKEESLNLLGKDGNRTRYRSIANEQQVFEFLTKRYKNIQVDVINIGKLSLKDQLKEMLATTIFITPNGGISMSIPFLPIDSYAIIMDYYGGEKKPFFHYDNGDSASMEVSFWNLWTHVNKMYYQVFTDKDYVWDVPGSKSYRDDASILVNLDRIEFMINEALHHYGS